MPDSRFFETLSPLSVVELAAKTGGEAVRGGDRMIGSVAPLSSADGGAIAFMGDRKFVAALAATQAGCVIVPGFIDVHLHGMEGVDVLDSPAAVSDVARRLPRYGVTAFCPTSVACAPERLKVLLQATHEARRAPDARASRVIGAHLEIGRAHV